MLLKRSLALAVGILLFLGVFFTYFEISDVQREERFHQERLKLGVEGNVPISSDPSLFKTVPAPSQPAASSSDQTATPAPAANAAPAPTDNPTPAASTTPDTNVIIGPLPPSNAPTPDSAPAPAIPTTPDTNAAPATPSSTMVRPRLNPLSLLIFAAYEPSNSAPVESSAVATNPPSASPSTNASTATTNTETTNAPAETSSTNVPNETASMPSSLTPEGPRPVPFETSAIVLGYHQFVGPGESSKNIYVMKQDVFESEMKYLKDNGYHVVPLSDVVKYVKHEIGLPPNSVAISIDDGYKSAIVWAAPILKKYGYPWTYFVYPDFITVNEGKGAASWNDLLALQADGVDIECHSMTHPQLTKKSQKIKGVWHNLSPEEYDQFLTNETSGAKALLEKKLGKTISYFAYPYGAYNKEVEAKVIAAGFDAIFTVADNPVHSTTDKYSIGRYVITQPVERAFASYLRQGALSVAGATPAPGTTISDPRPTITAVLDYAGNLDPKSIETSVRDYGEVHHDFDPKTSTIRLYLPRDLIQPVNIVNIRVKDADSGQVMVANWHFNYEPASAAGAAHAPIGSTPPATNSAPLTHNESTTDSAPATNTAPASAKTVPSSGEASSTNASSINSSGSISSSGTVHSASSKNPTTTP